MATFSKAQLKKIIKEEYEAITREPVTEGNNEVSRMITKLEEIGKLVEFSTKELDYDTQPEVAERLERAEQMIQELWGEMHDLLEQKPSGYSDVSGQRPMQEDFENDQQFSDSKEDVLRQIVAQGQRAKVQGTMVDLFSASAIVTVLDALSPENKKKYLELEPLKMAQIAFKLLK